MEPLSETTSPDLRCALRWGLSDDLVQALGRRLHNFWRRDRDPFANRRRDPSRLAEIYLRAQLTMESKRNFANLSRRLAGDEGQALKQFMSQSPWSARAVLDQLQDEVARQAVVQSGSALMLDESADEKAGSKSAGGARPYKGHLGKVDLCQLSLCRG